MRIRIFLCVLLSAWLTPTQALGEDRRVGSVDFYGLRNVTEEQVRSALGFGLGMSRVEAIRTATIHAADLLGVEDRARIAPGLLADLIGAPGNPVEDVRQFEDVRFVMMRLPTPLPGAALRHRHGGTGLPNPCCRRAGAASRRFGQLRLPQIAAFSGSVDKTVRLWDSRSGGLLSTLTGHEAAVVFLDFNPDGTRLASFSDDKTVLRWDTSSGELVATAMGR